MDGRSKRKKDIPVRYCIVCNSEIPRNTKQGENRIRPTQYIKAMFCSKECKGVEHSKKMIGKDNPSWKGGKSFEPYSVDWTNTLKRAIRERDHYQCRICGELQNNEAFHVHHIDYNKQNCNPDNLITLCNSCHSKTNHNRDYWIKNIIINIK